MHDLAIRGGTIRDGSGGAARADDLAIDDGIFSEIAGALGPLGARSTRTVFLVMPGWLDAH